MRVLRVALVALVCSVPLPAAADSDPLIARVRSSDPSLIVLIDRAGGGSATFQRLLAAIARSNGIVYVELGTCSHGVRACLPMWMHTVGPNRFLRIVLDPKKIGSDGEKMWLLGHELQHAVEALSEKGVTDSRTLYAFFGRLAPTNSSRFETADAIHAGEEVRYELARREGRPF